MGTTIDSICCFSCRALSFASMCQAGDLAVDFSGVAYTVTLDAPIEDGELMNFDCSLASTSTSDSLVGDGFGILCNAAVPTLDSFACAPSTDANALMGSANQVTTTAVFGLLFAMLMLN